MICLALPIYAKNKSYANKLIKDFIEIAMEDGYFLSCTETIDCAYHDNLPYDVTVSYITFEAKYTSLDVELESNPTIMKLNAFN